MFNKLLYLFTKRNWKFETGNWINKDLIFLKLIKFLSKFQVSSFEFH